MAVSEAEVQPAPVLVHSGTYALYETPDGGRHLVYRRDGEDADTHLPDIPAAALPLIENFLAHGLPPAVLAMLSGKLSPMAVMKALRNGAGDAG